MYSLPADACRDLVEMSIYDELSLQDTDALSQVDDGADIVGMKQPFPLRCFSFHVRLCWCLVFMKELGF